MQLEINDKTYDIYFGLDFVEYLDKKYKLEQGGLEFGLGIVNAAAQLEQGSPLILVDLIKAGTITSGKKLNTQEVKQFIEQHEDLEELMNDFLTELEKAPVTKVAMNKARKMAQQAQ